MAHLTLLCFGLPKAEKQQKSAAPHCTITKKGNEMEQEFDPFVGVKRIQECVQHFVEHGYYQPPPAPEDWRLTIPYQSIQCHVRMIARRMKRPFVQLHKWKEESLTISVPKRRYTAPIINPLLLVATPGHRWASPKDGVPVAEYPEVTNWIFRIFDPDIMRGFMEHIKSPEARKAMRLPEKVAT